MGRTRNWGANIAATALAVAGWGYFLYQGVVDPLGGINTLWPLFGIANQMLAAIALILCTAVLFKMKRERYAWVTILPTVWLVVCTLTAGWQKLFDANPAIGFLAAAGKFSDALAQGKVLAPAKTVEDMHRVITNSLCGRGADRDLHRRGPRHDGRRLRHDPQGPCQPARHNQRGGR